MIKRRLSEEGETNVKRTKTSTKQQVSFLVLSDTHEIMLDGKPFGPSNKVDVLLHCGDLTENGSHVGFKKALELLNSIEAELKLVIAGNHDLSLDKNFYISQGGSLREHDLVCKMMRSPSITYLREGIHTFKLKNGARFTIYASPYTPREYSPSTWAFQYHSSKDRFNPQNCQNRPSWADCDATKRSVIKDVDIVMTHTPPKYILDRNSRDGNCGCEHLRRAVIETKPLLHCFGHIHEAWGASRVAWKSAHTAEELEDLEGNPENGDMVFLREFVSRGGARRRGFAELKKESYEELERGRQTLFINAAIDRDQDMKPLNPPWLVKLKLDSYDEGL